MKWNEAISYRKCIVEQDFDFLIGLRLFWGIGSSSSGPVSLHSLRRIKFIAWIDWIALEVTIHRFKVTYTKLLDRIQNVE